MCIIYSDLTLYLSILFCSGSITDPWLRIDFGQEYEVSAVNIFPVEDSDSSTFDGNSTQLYY